MASCLPLAIEPVDTSSQGSESLKEIHYAKSLKIGDMENPTEFIDIHSKIPRADGGKHAWLFLAGCFVFEALIWGKHSSKSWVRQTHISKAFHSPLVSSNPFIPRRHLSLSIRTGLPQLEPAQVVSCTCSHPYHYMLLKHGLQSAASHQWSGSSSFSQH